MLKNMPDPLCVAFLLSQVRHICLVAASRILFVASPSTLEGEGLRNQVPTLAGLLRGRDATAAAYAIQASEKT